MIMMMMMMMSLRRKTFTLYMSGIVLIVIFMYSSEKLQRHTGLTINNTEKANSLKSSLKRKENKYDSQKTSNDDFQEGDLPKGNILNSNYLLQTGDSHKYLEDMELPKAPSSENLQKGDSAKKHPHALTKMKLTQKRETGEESPFEKDESKNIQSHKDEREKWVRYQSPRNINVNEQFNENETNELVRTLLNTIENKTFEAARRYVKNLINNIQPPNDAKVMRADSYTSEASKILSATQNTSLIIQHTDTLIPRPDTISSALPRNNTSPRPYASDQRRNSEGKNNPDGVKRKGVSREGAAVVTQVNWLLTKELPTVGRLKRPVLTVDPSAKVIHNATWHGYPKPIITFKKLGRLGNVMGAYASVWALRKIYGTTVFMEEEVEDVLKSAFPHLSMTRLPVRFVGGSWLWVAHDGSPNLTDYTPMEAAAAGLKGARTIAIHDYPQEMQLFNAYRDDLVREFTFSIALKREAQRYLNSVTAFSSKSPSFVGVHVRGTDFAAELKDLFHVAPPGQDYLLRALAFYRQRLRRVIFVVASEDMDFARELLEDEPDVVFAPGSPRELDMAVLAACNHSVITIGSFGFWSGYLAGGAVVYPDLRPKYNTYHFTRGYYERANLTQFIPLPP